MLILIKKSKIKHFTYILFFSIGFSSCLFSQNQLSPSTKRFLFDLENELSIKQKNGQLVSNEFIQQYDLYPYNGDYYVGFLLLHHEKISQKQLRDYRMTYSGCAGDIHSCRIPISHFKKFISDEHFVLMDIGDPVDADLTLLRESMRVDSVHQGLGGIDRSYSGKGVIIGVIDWGFDYTHPMFYDSTLQKYRVLAAWDQNKLSGPPPSNFDFGTAYETKEVLLNAGADTMYVFGPSSHGSHVAGIAGGGGGGTSNIGVAPDADLVFISLRRDAASLMDAYLYIEQVAKKHNKPFVVNMSFGSHLGPHDGMDLKNKAIDRIVNRGKISVGSAGNNGNNNFHILHHFNTTSDTLKSVVGFNNISSSFGQTLSMWGSENSIFKVRFRVVRNNLSDAFITPWFSSEKDSAYNVNFSTAEFDSLFFRLTITESFATNQRPNIRAEIRKKTSLRLLMEVVGDEGANIHIWNNVRMYSRYTNWGVDFLTNYPGTKGGDMHYGVGEPGGVGKSVLTVASYRPELIINNLTIHGRISNFSSYGPTTDERRKPDIAGPGHFIVSSVNSYDETSEADHVETVEFNGRTYGFARYSGTSMSGPAVAGMVALLLEKNPTLDHNQIKEIILNTARIDEHTGEIKDTGSLIWGFGKAHALNALLEADNYPIFKDIPDEINVYPNPSGGYWNIAVTEPMMVELYNLQGQKIFSGEIVNAKDLLTIDNHCLIDGMYILRLSNQNQQIFRKLIKASGF